ncbi:MAG TPA: 50S ribosomal protein L15 [Woeseiaceae bacterium]|nr:50S ribosomal protein L15 [Woeseiaceae bacterium]
MRLNSLTPQKGSKKDAKRFGRGHSAGQGKTSGRGQKGQHARSGGYTKVGFEGGQMPLQRRLPKVGFTSLQKSSSVEVRLHELALPEDEVIDMAALRKARLISAQAEKVKVILSGKLEKAVRLKGVKVTKGARAAIEAAGGSVEE